MLVSDNIINWDFKQQTYLEIGDMGSFCEVAVQYPIRMRKGLIAAIEPVREFVLVFTM